jgi:hypothetical protein
MAAATVLEFVKRENDQNACACLQLQLAVLYIMAVSMLRIHQINEDQCYVMALARFQSEQELCVMVDEEFE